jgi:transposase
MRTVDDFGKIRCAFRDGLSIREIARTFHLSRRTVRKALRQPEPPPYTRSQPRPAPKLGPFQGVIDALLTADEQAPPKQRHTAMQVFRRLCAEHGYQGGYDQVRRYIGRQQRHGRETFIPLSHEPGQRVEADFGEIAVDFPAGRQKVPVLLVTWSYSNCPFALAQPTQRTEAILGGLVEAFAFFGCVPREVWWDNPTTVAVAVLQGRQRQLHPRYAALASHYTFEPLFCMPRRGNEKPRVENRVYDLERRWGTPVPRMRDRAELNAYLRQCCLQERAHTIRGCAESIAARFERERGCALPLPGQPFDACVVQPAKVDKYQLVRFDQNSYSVPRAWAFQAVTVKGYVDTVAVVAGGQVVAHHGRSYDQHQQVLDPLHYLTTLGRRPAALDHAPVYRHWQLPEVFAELRQALEQRHGGPAGARQYVRVLQLLAAHPVERVRQAIEGSRQPGGWEVERVLRLTERLADQGGGSPSIKDSDSHLMTPLGHIRVPEPDLGRFNQLLEQGGKPHDGGDESITAE